MSSWPLVVIDDMGLDSISVLVKVSACRWIQTESEKEFGSAWNSLWEWCGTVVETSSDGRNQICLWDYKQPVNMCRRHQRSKVRLKALSVTPCLRTVDNLFSAECNFELSRRASTAFYVEEMLDAQSIFVCQGWQSLRLTFRFPLSAWDEAKLGSRFPLSSVIYWQKSWFFTISHPGSLSGCCGRGEMTSSAIFHFKLYVLSSFLYNLKPICCISTVVFSI